MGRTSKPPSGESLPFARRPAIIIRETAGGPFFVVDRKEAGERLKKIREHIGYSSAKRFAAECMQIEYTTWHAYESGQNLISIGLALRLIKLCPGLTLDWIYRREFAGLSHDLWRVLKSPTDILG
jgi:DNA-binding XRE family transcriptional regulator